MAALAAGIVWEIRSDATSANANGGGFKTGATGTDYSTQAAAQYNITTGTSAGAGAVIQHASAAADMVGNVGHLISGTNATAGWYEIISVSVGVSITVNTNCTTGVGASIVFNIGGALSMNDVSDVTWAGIPVSGNTVWYKQVGTITLGGTYTIANGTLGTPIVLNGYKTTRGDGTTAANRPTINAATFTMNTGTSNTMQNIIITGTAANLLTVGASSIVKNVKATNTSTTAARVAFNVGSLNSVVMSCEGISYRGNALVFSNNSHVLGNYLHDSNIGISYSGTSVGLIANNIIESCVAQAINVSGAVTNGSIFMNNTLYGGENKTGVGFNLAAGVTGARIIGNIIYGFTTGIADASTAGDNFGDYNALNNNTANYSTFVDGSNSITTAPGFKSVAQITGATATTSGSVLTQAGGTFSGITNNQDFCYIVSGTGITAGQYLITANSATTLTLDIAPGTSAVADKVFQVTTGRNFAIGANYKGAGFPASFPAALSTPYNDIGAVARLEDYPTAANTKTGVVYSNSEQTGTYTGSDRWSDPGSTNVKSGTQYKANSASNNMTGSYSGGSGTTVIGRG